MNVSIVIPTYQGRSLLEKYLPSVIDCAGGAEIVVVDDASLDGTQDMLRERFGGVRLVRRSSNGGFAAAANDGIRNTAGDLVLLLNNDVEVRPGLADAVQRWFAQKDVFAVSPRVLLPSRGWVDEGAKTGFWRHGMFYVDQRQGVTKTVEILYATACAAAYRRSMLEELGGFDEAFSPFYWEDADLGYRAWKRGWRSLYEPAAAVHHQHAASTSRLDQSVMARIKARNGLLFIWRNIEDPALARAHRAWLPIVIARRAAVGDWAFAAGWRDAFARRHEAAQARRSDSARRVISDREILARVGIEVQESR